MARYKHGVRTSACACVRFRRDVLLIPRSAESAAALRYVQLPAHAALANLSYQRPMALSGRGSYMIWRAIKTLITGYSREGERRRKWGAKRPLPYMLGGLLQIHVQQSKIQCAMFESLLVELLIFHVGSAFVSLWLICRCTVRLTIYAYSVDVL